MRRTKPKTTSILDKFVFGLSSFQDCIRDFFHPRDSYFCMSELFTTTLRCRSTFVCHVSVAGLLVWPAIVRGVQRRAFSECTTKLLPELTCKPYAEYLLLLSPLPSFLFPVSLRVGIIKVEIQVCVVFFLRTKVSFEIWKCI